MTVFRSNISRRCIWNKMKYHSKHFIFFFPCKRMILHTCMLELDYWIGVWKASPGPVTHSNRQICSSVGKVFQEWLSQMCSLPSCTQHHGISVGYRTQPCCSPLPMQWTFLWTDYKPWMCYGSFKLNIRKKIIFRKNDTPGQAAQGVGGVTSSGGVQ